MALPMPNLGPR